VSLESSEQAAISSIPDPRGVIAARSHPDQILLMRMGALRCSPKVAPANKSAGVKTFFLFRQGKKSVPLNRTTLDGTPESGVFRRTWWQDWSYLWGRATHHGRRRSNCTSISVHTDAPFPSGNFGGQAGPSQAKNPIVVKDRCPPFLR
jgi:hypothetical protein